MTLRFAKYQGTGNDFLLIDGLKGLPDVDWAAFARRWCDRHYGVGGDGVILVLEGQSAPFAMRVINADGSEPEMCGNGLRCFVKYLADRGLAPMGPFDVETGAGTLRPEVLPDGRVRVEMGAPILERSRIPMAGPEAAQVVEEPIAVGAESFLVTAVSMGNPHAVIFVPDAGAVPLAEWGPALERHPSFPARTNVEFTEVLNRREARMRVWERGAGPTLACGTGACATLVAGVLTGRLDREATIHLPGGPLAIAWPEGGPIVMTGAAEAVFEGELPLA
ncbi:MAG: diaminopimelate epimerase [Candidatus Sericytochromatia bacterium]